MSVSIVWLRPRPTLRSASDRKLNIPELLTVRYQIAFLEDDKAEMKIVSELGREKSGMEDWLCDLQSSVLAYHGHLKLARIKSQRAAALARHEGHPEKE